MQGARNVAKLKKAMILTPEFEGTLESDKNTKRDTRYRLTQKNWLKKLSKHWMKPISSFLEVTIGKGEVIVNKENEFDS